MPAANDRDSSSSLTGKAKSGAWTPTSTRLKFNDWGRVRHSSPSVRSMAVALVFCFNQKRCRSPPNKKHEPFTLSVPHVQTPREMQTMSMPTLQIRVPLWPSLKDQDATARQEARNHGVGYESEHHGLCMLPHSPQMQWMACRGLFRTWGFPELTTSNYMKIWQNNRYRVLKYLPGFTCRSLAALWRAGSSSTFWHGIIPNRTWPKTFP